MFVATLVEARTHRGAYKPDQNIGRALRRLSPLTGAGALLISEPTGYDDRAEPVANLGRPANGRSCSGR